MPGEQVRGVEPAARGRGDCAPQSPQTLRAPLAFTAKIARFGFSLARPMLLLSLAAGLYWHLSASVRPELVYHADGPAASGPAAVGIPVFLRGGDFRAAFFRRPGGPMEYCAAALAQFCYYPWAGSAILTACAVLLYANTALLLRVVGLSGGWLWALVPALLLLWNYNRYVLGIDVSLAIALNLLLGSAYLILAKTSSSAIAAPLLPALIVLAYLLTGPSAMLMAGVCVLWELLVRRNYLIAATGLATAIALPAICAWWLQLVPTWDYRQQKAICPWLAAPDAGQLAIYVALMTMVLLRCSAVAVARWRPSVMQHVSSAVDRLVGWLCKAVALCAVLAASVAIALGTLDRQLRWTLQLNYLARTEQWTELLDRLEGYPADLYTASLLCDVCRALYETGRLGSDLFRCPQQPAALFQRSQEGAFVRGSGEVLFLLGCVNEAEHVAHESLEVHGERPDILRLLARVHLAKGNPAAARVFLNVLRNDLIHGDWAAWYLQQLEDNPADAGDSLVQAARANMPQADRLAEQATDEDVLLGLLEHNPANRMAVEYLLAYYLLTRQPAKLAQHFERFKSLRSAEEPHRFPPLLAEALAWSTVGPLRSRPQLPMDAVDPQAFRQVTEAMQLARHYGSNQEALDAELAQRFPYSFSRYLITGRSGAGQ